MDLGIDASAILTTMVVAALIILGAVLMVFRLYRKVEQGRAIIVSKMRSVRVSFTSALVLPVVHKAEYMDISVKTIDIDRSGHDGLICMDNIRADIRITFFVRVNKTQEDVIKVAQSIGTERASDQGTLQELFNAKFSEALKTVGKQLDFTDLYTDREQFRDRIINVIGTDLNGYSLEDAAIDYLEQTPMAQLDSQNILDAQGIRKITELTAKEAITTNEHRRHEEREIKRQDVDARETILELERRQEEAEIRQQREVETLRAREEAEVAKVQNEERLKAESARIRTDEQTGIQIENQQREIAVASKNRERVIAVETERIEKDRILEVVAREREEELATISKDKEVEGEKRDIAEVIRERIAVEKTVAEQEESIKRLRTVEEAERERDATVIAAEAQAQENLVKDIKAAEAAESAAKHKARERLTMAEAGQQAAEMDAAAKKRQADGDRAVAAAPGLADAQVKEQTAVAIEKTGLAEAKAKEAGARADAEAIEASGLAEAKSMREKLRSESEGLTEKAAAMSKLDAASREHEEYRLRLENERAIREAEIDARREIAGKQAEVLATGLESADISLVGGDSQFFDRVVGAIGYGKAVDGFMKHSDVAQNAIGGFLNGSEDFGQKFRDVISAVSSEDVKNLSVAALLVKLINNSGEGEAGPLTQLLDQAHELGIANRPASAINALPAA